MIVIDDHTLLALLADSAADSVLGQAAAGEVFTTGTWYYRLARAVRDPLGGGGSLSQEQAGLSADLRAKVVNALDDLPEEIGLLSARVLVPVMASLSSVGRFNLLNAEAIAACLVLDAGLRVVAAAPMLRSACEQLGIDLEVAP